MVVLPLPVGPAHSTMPNGARMSLEYISWVSGGMPRSPRRRTDRFLSRIAHDAVLAPDGGAVETRTSVLAPSISVVSCPSWGRRRSTMFMPAMILMRLTRPRPMDAGSIRTSFRAPSIRKRTRTTSWRLDVHVRGPVAHGLGRCGDDLDDGGVVGHHLGSGPVDRSLRRLLHRLEGLHQLVDAADCPVAAVDGPSDVDSGARAKSTGWPLVSCRSPRSSSVGWYATATCNASSSRRSGTARNLGVHLLGHQGEGLGFRIVTAQVHDWHAEDLSHHPSELTLAEHAHVDEDLAQPLTRVLLCDTGLAHL